VIIFTAAPSDFSFTRTKTLLNSLNRHHAESMMIQIPKKKKFDLPDRNLEELEIYWNNVDNDGESASTLDIIISEDPSMIGADNNQSKKKWPPRKKNKNTGALGDESATTYTTYSKSEPTLSTEMSTTVCPTVTLSGCSEDAPILQKSVVTEESLRIVTKINPLPGCRY
jgi:hypothetical protein